MVGADIKTPADLKGKRLSAAGGIGGFNWLVGREVLRLAGLTPDDAQFISQGTAGRLPGNSVSTSMRFGAFCSQNATRTSRPGRMRLSRAATARALAADRGSLLPCAVSTSVLIRRATRIRSWPAPASARCAGRRPQPA